MEILVTYEDLGNERFEVHDDGEMWAAALWDLRKELGQDVTDQLVVDGVKFTPCGPSMIDARDGILMADQTINGAANRAKIWEVFARHGMGNSAGGIDGSSLLKDTVYTAAFDLPRDLNPHFQFDSDLSTFRRPSASLFIGARAR